MSRATANRLIDKWRIVETGLWDVDYRGGQPSKPKKGGFSAAC
jgi:hypothetical protein